MMTMTAVHCAAVTSSSTIIPRNKGDKTDATSTSSCLQILFKRRFPPGGDTSAWAQTARDEFDSHYAMKIKWIHFNGKQIEQVRLIKINVFKLGGEKCCRISASLCIFFFIIILHQLKVCENSAASLKRPLAFACQPGLSVATVHLMTLVVTRGESPLPETQTVLWSAARVA